VDVCLRSNACQKGTKMGALGVRPTVRIHGRTLSAYSNRGHAHASIHVLPIVRKLDAGLGRVRWRRSSRINGRPRQTSKSVATLDGAGNLGGGGSGGCHGGGGGDGNDGEEGHGDDDDKNEGALDVCLLLAALPALQQSSSSASDGTGQAEDVFELTVDDDEDYTEDEEYDGDEDDEDDDVVDDDGIDSGGRQNQGSRGMNKPKKKDNFICESVLATNLPTGPGIPTKVKATN